MKKISMNLLTKEVIEKSNINLKDNIKSIKFNRDTFLIKKILERQCLFQNDNENINFEEQLKWIENEILTQIKEKGYFDKIYYAFEFTINDEEYNGNTVNYNYYHHIEKINRMIDFLENTIFYIEVTELGSREFGFELVFNKKSILLDIELKNEKELDISKLKKANTMFLKHNFKYYILECLTEIFANVGMRCVYEDYNFSLNRFGKYEFIFRSEKIDNKTSLKFSICDKLTQEIIFVWENIYIKNKNTNYIVNEKEIDFFNVYSTQKHLIRDYKYDKKKNIDDFILEFFINMNFEKLKKAIDIVVEDEFNKKYKFKELEKYYFDNKIDLKENDKRVEWEKEDYFYCFGARNMNNGIINILGIFSSCYNEFDLDFTENQIGVFKIYKDNFEKLKESEITMISDEIFENFIVLDNITDIEDCYVPYDFLKQFYNIKSEDDIFKTIFQKLDFFFFNKKN